MEVAGRTMQILNEFRGELVAQNRDSSKGINKQGRHINIVQIKLAPSAILRNKS